MASTEIGVHHPDGEDAFAPHTDMRLLAESLTPRAIVPVVNAADADALAAEVNPTPQAPLFVYRSDIDQLLRYIAPDASAVIGGGDSGWVTIPYQAGFAAQDGRTLQVREVGIQVYLRGSAVGPMSQSAYTTVGVVPPEFRPSRTVLFLGVSGTVAQSGGRCYVDTSGNIRLSLITTATTYVDIPGGHLSWFRD